MAERKSQKFIENVPLKGNKIRQTVFFEQVKEFINFERTCSSNSSGYIETLSFLVSMHTLFSYFLLSNHPYSFVASQAVKYLQQSQRLQLFLQLTTYLTAIALIVNLYAARLKYNKHIWSSSVKRVISHFGILTRIVLTLNSFLLLIDPWRNSMATILLAFSQVVDCLFLANYYQKKKNNYQSSQRLSLIKRIGIIFEIVINSFIVNFGTLETFYFSAVIFALLTFLWHSQGGYQLYFHKIPRRINIILCGSIIANGVIFSVQLLPWKQEHWPSIVELTASMLVIMLYLYLFQEKQRFSFRNPEKLICSEKSVKDYELNLSILQEESDDCKNKENLLIGIVTKAARTCRNPRCLFKLDKVYDPYLRHTVFPQNYNSMVRQKDSVLRFFLKCFYHQALLEHKNKQRMIDFVEFCLSQVGDFSSHCLLLSKLQNQDLNFYQKIKVYKLKLILKEQSDTFNRLVIASHIELDQTLMAEDIFSTIQTDINRYCTKNIDIWGQMTWMEIDLFELKEKLRESLDLIDSIIAKWNQISKFLKYNKHWRYIYLNFALFLKNEKMKNSTLHLGEEEEANEVDEINERIPLFDRKDKGEEINEEVFFHRRTALFQCYLEEGDLRFAKVSKSFEEITGISEKEVIGSLLNMILPEEIRARHKQVVVDYLESGYTADQKSYNPKHVSFVNKKGEQNPALVFFKLYVSLLDQEHLLSFVSLMKSGKSREVGTGKYTEKTIQKRHSTQFWAYQEGSDLTLNPACNIFLKEDNFEPARHVNQISRIKLVSRCLTVLLILVLVVLALIIKKSGHHVEEHSKVLVNFSHLYHLGFTLGKYYLNIVDEGSVRLQSKIAAATAEIRKYKDDPITIEALFDPSIVIPVEYLPSEINSINEGIAYSSTDLFYLIFSCIATLSNSPANRTGHDFMQLNSYISPGYDSVLNSSKAQIYLQIQKNMQETKQSQLFLAFSLVMVVVVAIAYVICKIDGYFAKMRGVLDIVVQFNSTETEKIINFWQKVTDYFKTMTKTRAQNNFGTMKVAHLLQNSEDFSQQKDQTSEKVKPKVTLNQHHKLLSVSEKERSFSCKVHLLVSGFLLGFLILLIGVQIVTYKNGEELDAFHEGGKYLIRDYPTTSIAAYAVVKKLYHTMHPELPFNPEVFMGNLQTLKVIVDYPRLVDVDPSSLYYQKLSNYLFGNPCTYNPQILIDTDVPSEFCLETADRSLTNGIISYLRYVYPIIEGYIKGELKMTKSQLQENIRGISLVGYYLSDAIDEWQAEFSSKIQQYISEYVLKTIILCLLLLFLHVLIFEISVIRHMTEDYAFMRSVFAVCVPAEILSKQKLIRHQFYQTGILMA